MLQWYWIDDKTIAAPKKNKERANDQPVGPRSFEGAIFGAIYLAPTHTCHTFLLFAWASSSSQLICYAYQLANMSNMCVCVCFRGSIELNKLWIETRVCIKKSFYITSFAQTFVVVQVRCEKAAELIDAIQCVLGSGRHIPNGFTTQSSNKRQIGKKNIGEQSGNCFICRFVFT